MSDELKPCPFCGSLNLGLNYTEPGRMNLWWVDCYECAESSHPRESRAAAVEAWNRRATLPTTSHGGKE